MKKKCITVLGSGTSTGVPIPTCRCDVCTSTDPRDKRLRTSILIETEGDKTILIDTTPDLRQQLLRTETQKVDATIITHAHADHLHGIDDLRPYSFNVESLPVYTYSECAEEISERFGYAFDLDKPKIGGGAPKLTLNTVPINTKTQIADLNFEFFLLPHGRGETLAFIAENMGYIIDCHEVPDEVVEKFRAADLELLLIDCLRPKPHQTHLHFDAAVSYAQKIGAKQTGLIHMSHHFSHVQLENWVKDQNASAIFPVYDQMTFNF